MTKARDLANIISSGFTADDIPNLPASKITSGELANDRVAALPTSKITSGTFADARIAASNVSQHATSFDDNKIVNDISTLALRQASDNNKSAYNTNSQFVDVFQDSTGITNLTNVSNVDEYLASVYNVKTQFIPSLHRTSTNAGALATPSWTGSESTADSMCDSPSSYGGVLVNHLWDLSGDFECKMFFGNSGGSGALETMQYTSYGLIITPDVSIASGADPNIFASASSHTWYGNNLTGWQDGKLLTSSAQTAFGTASMSANAIETGSSSANVTNSYTSNKCHYAYFNTGTEYCGSKVTYDKSANTIVIRPIGLSGSSPTFPDYAVKTVTNVPTAGRVVMGFGEAIGTVRKLQTSYANGSKANDDFSYYSTSTASATGLFESNAITAPSSVSKMGAIITYQNQAGVNALNTDIVLQLSADGGSNFTTATMTALPDFSTGIKMAKVNDLTIGTAGTSLKYKLSFANQASGSKEARIRGVSLQY